ncbi:MAG: zinc-binding dehydrogenase [Vicinamibacteria bacterium]
MSATMRAAVLHGPEDVRMEDVPAPVPGPGEVVVRVGAALTCGTDVKVFRRGYHARMITPPALFGHEMAGTVEAMGDGVRGFWPGATVVTANSAPCGACAYCAAGRESLCDDLLFWNGAYAELALVPERIVRRNLLLIPADLPFRKAALTEPLACVVRGVSVSRIEPGQTVAVIGAGPIGLMFVRLASLAGARVVVAGRRQARLDKARAMGAAAVVDAAVAGWEDALRRETPGGAGAPVVVEASGTADGTGAALRAVRKGGLVQLFAGTPSGTTVPLDVARLHYEEITVASSFHHTPESVREALRLIATGAVDADLLITRERPLDDVPQALAEAARGSDDLKTAIVPPAR